MKHIRYRLSVLIIAICLLIIILFNNRKPRLDALNLTLPTNDHEAFAKGYVHNIYSNYVEIDVEEPVEVLGSTEFVFDSKNANKIRRAFLHNRILSFVFDSKKRILYSE